MDRERTFKLSISFFFITFARWHSIYKFGDSCNFLQSMNTLILITFYDLLLCVWSPEFELQLNLKYTPTYIKKNKCVLNFLISSFYQNTNLLLKQTYLNKNHNSNEKKKIDFETPFPKQLMNESRILRDNNFRSFWVI